MEPPPAKEWEWAKSAWLSQALPPRGDGAVYATCGAAAKLACSGKMKGVVGAALVECAAAVALA
eukprot:CAMPEP_0172686418 /NCGR_PEP_ID=MMETSP1074-20121228/20924_1 /TAXON_ID=2916 /ORGANISM="Ceratium fusus, Strain PA161109" /LENGTH=63 /DNA_ID=CAMNT_0013505717 /DNA_START=698 /DNA_END=889 /DNA_ORIENTATION=+